MVDCRDERNRRMQELYNAPANRCLKRVALLVIAVVIVLLLSMVFLLDHISPRMLLLMRGCSGLGALVFVVLVGVLVYRVNKAYIGQDKDSRH